ncbi:MAG: prepilin-type N-terminal cleavage/methylation domain-containing protein [Planctomycetota bacterium]|nr:prepilin-type N-terminal cleavage/methylation domain-containing protein [Planctomycetota bacterium]
MQTCRRSRRTLGFTLIELLVATALMVILVTAIAMIFHHTTDVVKVSEARILVYSNARAALDWLHKDLSGCLPVGGGQQRFGLAQNFTPSNGGSASNGNGENMQASPTTPRATDAIIFNATTMVAGSVQAMRILYCLDQDYDWSTQTGGTVGVAAGVKTTRPVYSLVRRVYQLSATWGGSFVPAPIDPIVPAPTPYPSNAPVERGALCEYVVSFNIEVLSRQGTFAAPGAVQTTRYFQLDQSGHPYVNSSANINAMPTYYIGAPTGMAGQCLPRAIRVTLRVVDGSAERTERLIPRVIWIPMSP